MKNKRILLIVLMIIFFVVVWYLQGMPLIWNPSLESLYRLNASASGYNSIIAYSLFYSIPFLFFIQNFFLSNNIIIITKLRNREIAHRLISKQILSGATIFSFLQLFVNVLLTVLHFDLDIIVESNFLLICLVNGISLFLFFSFVGLLNHIIKIVVGQYGLAVFFSFISIGTFFFFDKLILSETTWTIFKDLGIMTYYFYDNWSMEDISHTLLRLSAAVCLMYLLGSFLYGRKDFLYYE